MRISRRFSRGAAGAVSVAAVLAVTTACSSSSSSGGSAASISSASQSMAAANQNANENDVQVLNSLQLTTQELDSAFASDNSWKVWAGADPSKIMLRQAWACTQNMIDTKDKSLQPVTTFFRADSLPSDPAATPTSSATSSSSSSSSPSSSKSSSHKSGSSSTSSSSGSGGSSGSSGDGNPAHWVVSTAIAYKTADAARAAVNGMGTIDPNAPSCGGPGDGDKDEIVGGGIGEVAPSWDNSLGVFVFTDTQSHVTIAAVAQRRGRYVVLTYTRGSAKANGGYYDLEAGADTGSAASAATGVLGQLTNAVVGSGS
jgi:hypothetical protein